MGPIHINESKHPALWGESHPSEAVACIVNRSIEELVNRCIKGSRRETLLDIASVIGYGDEAQSAWQGKLADATVTPEELRRAPTRPLLHEKRSARRGVEIKEVQRTQWLEAKHQGDSLR